MFRIRQVFDASSPQNQSVVAQVARIYQAAFAYYPEYAATIARLLQFEGERDFEVVLLVAEGLKNRILGFALSFAFPDLKLAYLDYVVSDPKRSRRGYGTALYEAIVEHYAKRRYAGLLMDVPPDEESMLKEPKRLTVNRRRMAFYERAGARPIIGTLYDAVTTPANQGYLTFLVYDDLETGRPLARARLRAFLPHLLAVKGGMAPDDPEVRRIVDSVKDDPVRLRAPRYVLPRPVTPEFRPVLHLVSTGDAHQIHHLREKGYVEKPARVSAILRGLRGFAIESHPVRTFGLRHVTAVHDPDLVRFLRLAETELRPGRLVYPNVFPIRRPDRMPKTWEMQAGYYCMDTFTPVTRNAFAAARAAANAALTGAELLRKGTTPVYVLCRPPGHHAERRAFGGFCYFNNAAVAAHYLSHEGKVALLDIDHHHGNGTQDIFWKRDDVFFVSIHGHPRAAYPYFAGYVDERGDGAGDGYNRNFPLYPGADNHEYIETLERALRLFVRFRPKYLVVSLGFDIMAGDPTGTFDVTERGMRRIGAMLRETGWPILAVQEGGYALRNLRTGAAEFFRGLAGG